MIDQGDGGQPLFKGLHRQGFAHPGFFIRSRNREKSRGEIILKNGEFPGMRLFIEDCQGSLVSADGLLDFGLVQGREILPHQTEIHLRFGDFLVAALGGQGKKGRLQLIAGAFEGDGIVTGKAHQRRGHTRPDAGGQ